MSAPKRKCDGVRWGMRLACLPVLEHQLVARRKSRSAGDCACVTCCAVLAPGIQPLGNQAVYAASKHGFTGWSNSIQQARPRGLCIAALMLRCLCRP